MRGRSVRLGKQGACAEAELSERNYLIQQKTHTGLIRLVCVFLFRTCEQRVFRCAQKKLFDGLLTRLLDLCYYVRCVFRQINSDNSSTK